MKARKIKRTPIFLLLLCFLLSMNSALPVFPLENTQTEPLEEVQLQETILNAEFLSAEAVQQAGHVKRLIDEEPNLNTAVFENEDGTYTMYAFTYAIKYVDENGAVLDKSNTLTDTFASKHYEANYAYAIEKNEFKTYFPKALNETNGVTLNTKEHTITMFAKGETVAVDQIKKFSPENVVTYPKVFGADTLLCYTPTLTGYKEELVLGTPGAGNSFEFVLDVGDLTAEVLPNGGVGLYETDGKAVVYSSDGVASQKSVGCISPLVAYDANGNRSKNNHIVLQKSETGTYQMIWEIDDDFLNNTQTVYPVTVAPAVIIDEGNGTQKPLRDVTIERAGNAFSRWNIDDLSVKYIPSDVHKESRAVIALPGLSDATNTESNLTFLRDHAGFINKAEVWLYQSNTSSLTGWVDVYAYKRAWVETNASISAAAFDYSNGDFLTTRGVGNNAGFSSTGGTGSGNWYNFSFLSALREWVSMTPATSYGTADNGIILCPYYEEDTALVDFEFHSTESAENAPCYVVNYSDYTHYNWRWLFDDETTTNRISSGYKTPGRVPIHLGFDIAGNGVATSGLEIKAPTNGKVVDKGYEDDQEIGRGYYLIIETYVKDLYTEQYIRLVFMHMQAASPLNINDTFTAGTFIGRVGNTGASNGAHLHLAVIRDGGEYTNENNVLNPERFFDVDFIGDTQNIYP